MEIWKDVKGYEGLYQVSNLGNVKSLPRKWTLKEFIMAKCFDTNGYHLVTLTKDFKGQPRKYHKLVAEAFIPNPENKPQVNHINGIKTDNRVENLEWATASENIKHSYDMLKRKRASKAIMQFDRSGSFVAEFESVKSAFEKTGVKGPCISMCLKKKIKTANGFIWRYKD